MCTQLYGIKKYLNCKTAKETEFHITHTVILYIIYIIVQILNSSLVKNVKFSL